MYIIRVAPVYSGWWVTIHLQFLGCTSKYEKKWNNLAAMKFASWSMKNHVVRCSILHMTSHQLLLFYLSRNSPYFTFNTSTSQTNSNSPHLDTLPPLMVSRQMGHWPKLQAVSTLLLAAAIASALILKGPLSTRAPQKNPWTACLKTLLQLFVAGRWKI